MHYDKIMGDFGYFHAESRKLWSSTCFLTPIIAGSVVNDQKMESFFARKHKLRVVLLSERAPRGAH